MTIIMPEYMNQRRPKTSYLIGQAMGETLGKASDLYLQNKIQGYFDKQKKDEEKAEISGARKKSATAIASAYKHPEWVEAMEGLEPQQQVALGKELASQSSDSSFLTKLIRGAKFEAPEQIQQGAPTPQAVATNQAAAQRMGMANQQPGQIPGMPQYAQQGQQGQLPFAMPQFQPAMGQQEPAATPAGVVPPEPTRGQGNGLDLASFQGKRLGEMSRDQLDALKEGQTADIQKQLEDAYNKQQSAMRGERTAATAEETLKFKKSEAEKNRKERKEERESKDSAKFLEEVDADSQPLILESGQLNQAMEAVKTGDVNGLYSYLTTKFGLDPLIPTNVSRFATANKEAYLNSIKSTGGRPNQWLEQTILDAGAKVGRKTSANMITLEQQKAEHDIKLARVLKANELRKKYMEDPEYGYVPAKIRSEVMDYQKQYADHRQDSLSYRVQQILENEKSDEDILNQKKLRSGTPLTLRVYDLLKQKNGGNTSNALKEAKSLGYNVLPESVYAEQQ